MSVGHFKIAAICVSSAVVCGLLYIKRWSIKLFWYKLRRPRNRRTRRIRANDGHGNYGAIHQDDGDADEGVTTYDAYISCAEDDYDWVRKHLLPVIDNGCLVKDEPLEGEFSCYFGERDSQPGKITLADLYNSGIIVKHSQRSVILKYVFTDKSSFAHLFLICMYDMFCIFARRSL